MAEDSKNLEEKATVKNELSTAATEKKTQADIKGATVSFAWYLKKNGYRELTIITAIKNLRALQKRGANLLDPESVKEVIANQIWADATRLHMVAC